MRVVQLSSIVARYEGKKHQATIGDIREILRILAELEAAKPGVITIYLLARARRIIKRRRKCLMK